MGNNNNNNRFPKFLFLFNLSIISASKHFMLVIEVLSNKAKSEISVWTLFEEN